MRLSGWQLAGAVTCLVIGPLGQLVQYLVSPMKEADSPAVQVAAAVAHPQSMHAAVTGTGRKFLRGPRGTGFLWVRDTALERLDPFVAEIRSATWDGGRGFTWADGARRFETWENSYVNIIGLGAAVQQALAVGLDAIGDRTRTLGERLREDLTQVPGVTTHDLGTHRCAIVTAKIAGRTANDVAAALGRVSINVSTTIAEHNPLDTEERGIHPLVRFSPHYYNTEAEIDRTVAAVAELASAGSRP